MTPALERNIAVGPRLVSASRSPVEVPAAARRSIRSPWLGMVEWTTACEICFPAGVPGFEDHRRLIPVEVPSQRPIVYLQSAIAADVCFVLLPAFVIDPTFTLSLSDEEEEVLGLRSGEGKSPAIGEDVACLALLTLSGDAVEADLGSPFVIGLKSSRGIQCSVAAGQRRFVLSADGLWTPPCL